jgi:PAS domain S-box-containing protein
MTNDQINIKTIVLIEDDSALGSLLKHKLEGLDLSVVDFTMGNQALDYILQETNPLLVMLDFGLPDINGISLLKKVLEVKKDIPFIAMTGAGSEEIAMEFLRLGAYDYLIKDSNFLNNVNNAVERAIQTYAYKKQIELQQQIIAQNEKKFRLIFENIQDVFAILDSRYCFKEISPAIETLLQIPPEMLLGKPVFYIISNRNQLKIALKMLLQEKRLTNFEIELCNKAKNIFKTCQINAKVIENEHGNNIIITLRDITNFKQLQRDFLTIVTQTEEKERTSISENLHDIIGPMLTTSRRYIEIVLETKKTEEEKKQLLNEILEILNQSISHIRQLSNTLSSHILSTFGVKKALLRFAQQYSLLKSPTIKIYFSLINSRFEPLLENIVYRTITELINNSIKHAEAHNVVVRLLEKDNFLFISFQDDGKGFDYQNIVEQGEKLQQQGIFLMNLRIKSLGGTIVFQRLNPGISYKIELPIQKHILPL